MNNELSERLTRLESTMTHSEYTIERLNEVVTTKEGNCSENWMKVARVDGCERFSGGIWTQLTKDTYSSNPLNTENFEAAAG